MRIPRLLAAALAVGCTIRTHRVEVSRVETGRTTTPEERADAPVATAVETDGRTFQVEAVQPRSCRTQVHRNERIVTEVQPKEKGKFWTQAVIAGAATTTAAITATQAEWWTTKGRTNFAVMLVSAPIAIGTGKRTLAAAKDMRGSTKTRTDTTLVDAGTWRACGEDPLDGDFGVAIRPTSAVSIDPVATSFQRGRSTDLPILTVPSHGWQASRWGIQLSSTTDETDLGPLADVPVRGSRIAAMETVYHEELALERAMELAAAARRNAPKQEPSDHDIFTSCYRRAGTNFFAKAKCTADFYAKKLQDGKKVYDALPTSAKEKLWDFAASVWADSQDTAGRLYSSPESRQSGVPELRRAPPGAPKEVAHPSTPEETSAYYVSGVLLYESGQPCRSCGVSLLSNNGVSSEKAYTDDRGRFTLTMRGTRVQKIYSDGWTIWEGNDDCYGGCYLKVYRR